MTQTQPYKHINQVPTNLVWARARQNQNGKPLTIKAMFVARRELFLESQNQTQTQTRDTVITVAVGRLQTYGTPYNSDKWNAITRAVNEVIQAYATVVARTRGYGITSDRPVVRREETYVVVAINPRPGLRLRLADLANYYGISSIMFSIDTYHEPVFPTKDSYRSPSHATTTATATANKKAHETLLQITNARPVYLSHDEIEALRPTPPCPIADRPAHKGYPG